MTEKIYLENNFNKLFNLIYKLNNNRSKKICVITDKNLERLYILKIQAKNFFYYSCSPGENSKTLQTVQNIFSFLLSKHFSQQDILISFGGGVICDLTGFIASSYMRGVKNFIKIPTSLLAQTDAAIGGKNALNFFLIKNLIGNIYPAKFIYINTNLLASLSQREISNGMSEIIKHALLNKKLFKILISNNNFDLEFIKNILPISIKTKFFFIKSNREFLNLGHTFGHAIESAFDFNLSHGEAISLGIICALYFSYKLNLINYNLLNQVIQVLKNYNLPTKINSNKSNLIYHNMLHDKKNINHKIKLILLKKISRPVIYISQTKQEIFNALNFILN